MLRPGRLVFPNFYPEKVFVDAEWVQASLDFLGKQNCCQKSLFSNPKSLQLHRSLKSLLTTSLTDYCRLLCTTSREMFEYGLKPGML